MTARSVVVAFPKMTLAQMALKDPGLEVTELPVEAGWYLYRCALERYDREITWDRQPAPSASWRNV